MTSPARIHVGSWVVERSRQGLRFPMLVVDHDAALEVFTVEHLDLDGTVQARTYAGVELEATVARGPERIKKKTGGP